MHTYQKSGNIWTVGYWLTDAIRGSFWMPLKDFSTEALAASYVNYLNGGTGDYSQ
jgi:hypothetical protein